MQRPGRGFRGFTFAQAETNGGRHVGRKGTQLVLLQAFFRTYRSKH